MKIAIYPTHTIKIATKVEYEREIKRIIKLFSQKETEETWDQFKRALDNLSRWITEGKISTFSTFENHIKELKLPIVRCLESPRTSLSASASGLIRSMAQTMETSFASKINPIFVHAIMKQLGGTNKVQTARVLTDYKEVIECAKLPKCIPLFAEYLTNKNKHKNNSHLRSCLAECLLVLIRVNPEQVLKKFSGDVEKAIHIACTDACPSVRSMIRDVYKAYAEKMPEQFDAFKLSLTSADRKHLECKKSVAISRSASSMPSRHNLPTRVSSKKSASAQVYPTRRLSPVYSRLIPQTSRKSSSTAFYPIRNQNLCRKESTSKANNTPQVDNTPLSSVNNHSDQQHVTHTHKDKHASNPHTVCNPSQEVIDTVFSSNEPEQLDFEAHELMLSSSSSSSSSLSFPSPSSFSFLPSMTEKRSHEDDTQTMSPTKKQKTSPTSSTPIKSEPLSPSHILYSEPIEESQPPPSSSSPPPPPPSSSSSPPPPSIIIIATLFTSIIANTSSIGS
ncbi:clasp N terminal-domain-containing protein [Blakeslea trispora]|nr:clasp N terminal-domain-containing protein [Blakeslea trispora]